MSASPSSNAECAAWPASYVSAPIALRGIKRAIRAAWSPEGLAVEREAFREALASEDAKTGVKAFLEGERPTFSGD